MDIKLTAGIEAVAQIAPRLSGLPKNGNTPRRGGANNRGSGGGARGGRGGRAPREPKPTRTAADLDAELDTYNSKMQTD